MKRFFFLSFVMLSSILSVGLFTSSSASAVSPYDDLVHTTSDLTIMNRINNPIDSPILDVTDCFNDLLSKSYLNNFTAYCGGNDDTIFGIPFTWSNVSPSNQSAFYDLWSNKSSSAVVQSKEANYNYIMFLATDDPSPQVEFVFVSGEYRMQYVIRSGYTYMKSYANLYSWPSNPDWNIGVGNNGYGISLHADFCSSFNPCSISTSFADWSQFYIDADILYPPDYEGTQPPSNPPVPTDDSSWSPNLSVFDNSSYKIQISDSNFFTFDNPAFLCGDGMIPLINFEIWDRGDVNTQGDETLLTTGFHSASSFITYEFPVIQAEKYYRVIAWYSGCDDLNFTESNFLDFTMTRYGTIYRPAFENCMVENFPWFNLEACMENFATISSMLTFGTIYTPPNFADIGNMQCYELQSDIASWLQVPSGMVLCPQLPASVRNTVTPFILFFLGLVTSRFLFTRRDI